ncbi:hypothetical protein GJ496_007079 [Pomphorhynchus laevis]|nr:hypothetical protein GJ496_007079 [Pomphorhynchus laevis]
MSSKNVDFQVFKQQIQYIIDENIAAMDYDKARAPAWLDVILSQIIEKLSTNKNTEKFVVIAGLHSIQEQFPLHIANSCYWTPNKDRIYTVKWENGSVCVIVTIISVEDEYEKQE